MSEQQLDSSAAGAAQCAQIEEGAATALYQQEEASSISYIHRHGTREYMQAEVMPYVKQALTALAIKVQQERLKLASGVDREGGKYLPPGWRPFCPHRWMAEYLMQNKPVAVLSAGQAVETAAGCGAVAASI